MPVICVRASQSTVPSVNCVAEMGRETCSCVCWGRMGERTFTDYLGTCYLFRSNAGLAGSRFVRGKLRKESVMRVEILAPFQLAAQQTEQFSRFLVCSAQAASLCPLISFCCVEYFRTHLNEPRVLYFLPRAHCPSRAFLQITTPAVALGAHRKHVSNLSIWSFSIREGVGATSGRLPSVLACVHCWTFS